MPIKMFVIAMKWHKTMRPKYMVHCIIVQVMKSAQQLSRRDVTSRRSAFALSHRFVYTYIGVIQGMLDAYYYYFFLFFSYLWLSFVDVAQISLPLQWIYFTPQKAFILSSNILFFFLFIYLIVCLGVSSENLLSRSPTRFIRT